METFDNFQDAFDYCREADKPITVEISNDGEFKLYPSGKAVRLTTISEKEKRMVSRTVKYFHKTSDTTFEPLAVNRAGLEIEISNKGLKWCKTCNAAVEPEGALDVQGIFDTCPFCGETIQ